ncbi:conserved hypothetical protein [Ricinus communis]|uniref:Uncharacterized protein n=1 Tax=Ricinus communis TaxID=3988 RepID=B9RCF6_RICCO|nr:conserved hypothetical protein [Ricinus communis]
MRRRTLKGVYTKTRKETKEVVSSKSSAPSGQGLGHGKVWWRHWWVGPELSWLYWTNVRGNFGKVVVLCMPLVGMSYIIPYPHKAMP